MLCLMLLDHAMVTDVRSHYSAGHLHVRVGQLVDVGVMPVCLEQTLDVQVASVVPVMRGRAGGAASLKRLLPVLSVMHSQVRPFLHCLACDLPLLALLHYN